VIEIVYNVQGGGDLIFLVVVVIVVWKTSRRTSLLLTERHKISHYRLVPTEKKRATLVQVELYIVHRLYAVLPHRWRLFQGFIGGGSRDITRRGARGRIIRNGFAREAISFRNVSLKVRKRRGGQLA